MVDTATEPTAITSSDKVLLALAALAPATAPGIGDRAGIGYSTTTSKLRALEEAGHAEKIRSDGRTLWQLTADGQSAARALAADEARFTDDGVPTQVDSRVDAADERPEEPTDEADAEPTPEPEPATGATPVPEKGPDPDDQHSADEDTSPDEPQDGQQPETPTDQSAAVSPHEPSHDMDDDTGTADSPDDAATTGSEPAPGPDDERQTDGAVQDTATSTVSTGSAEATDDPAPTGPATSKRRKPSKPKRAKGQLRAEVLALLQKNPDNSYKVGEICKLINQANEGVEVNPASPGAVANALDVLVGEHTVKRLGESTSTFQAE